jgi:hypothetical protein
MRTPKPKSKLVNKIGKFTPKLVPEPKSEPGLLWVDEKAQEEDEDQPFNTLSSLGRGATDTFVTENLIVKGNMTPTLPPQVYYTNLRVHIENYHGTGLYYPPLSLNLGEVVVSQSTCSSYDSYGSLTTTVTLTIGTPCLVYDFALESEIKRHTLTQEALNHEQEYLIKKLKTEISTIQDLLNLAKAVLKDHNLEDQLLIAEFTKGVADELNS